MSWITHGPYIGGGAGSRVADFQCAAEPSAEYTALPPHRLTPDAATQLGRKRKVSHLESEADICEQREQSSIGGDVAEALKRREAIDASGDHDVIRKRWTVGYAESRICTDAGVDRLLEKQQLQRFRVGESNQIKLTKPRSFGVISMSTPALYKNRPGLTKFA